MTHPSKAKGNRLERWAVNSAIESGIEAHRAYASNGESLGEHAEVDCLIGNHRIQAKSRKVLANHLIPSEHVDAQLIKADRQEALIVMRWFDWLDLVKQAQLAEFFGDLDLVPGDVDGVIRAENEGGRPSQSQQTETTQRGSTDENSEQEK